MLQLEELRAGLREQLSWGDSSEGQVFGPLHPASRGLFSAPSNPCFQGTFLLDLNTLGMAGLHPSLLTKAVFGALQGAGCPSVGEEPACKHHGICLLLLALWLSAGTQLLFPHPLPSFGGT